MTRFDGIQAAGKQPQQQDFEKNNASIDAQIEALNSSVPEQTSTKQEKEQAIRVKKEIINLKKEQLKAALRSNDTGFATSISNSIKEIEGEIDTIRKEIAGMTNIFDSKSDVAQNEAARKQNSVFT